MWSRWLYVFIVLCVSLVVARECGGERKGGGLDGISMPLEYKEIRAWAGRGSAKRVLIIGVDGMGGWWLDRIPFGVTLPNLEALRDLGAWTMYARAAMPTISKPNWMSIISGAGPEEHGVLDNDWVVGKEMDPVTGPNTYFPSLFQVAKNNSLKVASYTDWDGFDDLYPKSAIDYHYLARNDPDGLNVTLQMIKDIIQPRKADLMYLHIDDVDETGHHSGWGSDAWWKAVSGVDTQVGLLVQALKDAQILQETLVLLVADHGGEGNSHGFTDDFCMYVPFMAMGPGIKKGYAIPRSYQTGINVRSIDIASTALNALGLPEPSLWIGRVINQIYV